MGGKCPYSWCLTVHTFSKCIGLKVNIFTWPELELAYSESAVQRFNHYITRRPPNEKRYKQYMASFSTWAWSNYTLIPFAKMRSSCQQIIIISNYLWSTPARRDSMKTQLAVRDRQKNKTWKMKELESVFIPALVDHWFIAMFDSSEFLWTKIVETQSYGENAILCIMQTHSCSLYKHTDTHRHTHIYIYLYIYIYVYIYGYIPNPKARSGCDTRSIF